LRITDSRFQTGATEASGFPKEGLPEVAFLGRSNVGKSSLINALIGRKGLARTSSTPGRTQQAHFYRLNDTILFVDLPGYGYAKAPVAVRRRLAETIESYLTASRPLALLVMILDARHEPTQQDVEMYRWIEGHGLPCQLVGTKVDKLSRPQRQEALQRSLKALGRQDVLLFSSTTGEGKKELWQAIDHRIAK
jgi:GTP-binding protein